MRRDLTILLSVLLLVTACACAFGQKTTVDPNAAAQARQEEEDKPDTRLEQKVTLEASRKSVREIVAQLSEKSGVKLHAGLNDSDWKVRDRRMNVFAKETSLKDLMDSVAVVMKFQWAVSGKGEERTYRLYMDRKTEQETESMRLREEREQEEELARKRTGAIEAFKNANELSAEELEKLREENPAQYLAAKSGMAAGLGEFFSGAPGVAEAIAAGKPLSLSAGTLPPGAQEGLMKAWQGMGSLRAGMGDEGGALPEGIAGNMGDVSILINQHAEMFKSSPASGMMLGEISVKYGDKSFDLPLLDPDNKFFNQMAKAMIRVQEEGISMEQAMQDAQSSMKEAIASDVMKRQDGGEARAEHPEDPDLDRKIKMEPKGPTLEQVQQALQEASEFAVVSDNFGPTFGVASLTLKGEMPVIDVLKSVEESCHYNWFRRGNVLEFRDRDWYKKRANQIPDAWLEAWRKTLEKTGTLDLDSMVEMANLTVEQMNQNISQDEILAMSGVQWSVLQNRDLLRLYGSLNRLQKSSVMNAGLDLGGLNGEQAKILEALLTQRASAFRNDPSAKLVLSCTMAKRDSLIHYTFLLSTSSGLAPVEMGVTTPKYMEPFKQPEKKTEAEVKQ